MKQKSNKKIYIENVFFLLVFQVFPAALRAAKRRQNVIKEKVKLHEEAIRKKELVAPIAEEEAKLFPKDMWITEYQRNFCQTDDIKRHFGS